MAAKKKARRCKPKHPSACQKRANKINGERIAAYARSHAGVPRDQWGCERRNDCGPRVTVGRGMSRAALYVTANKITGNGFHVRLMREGSSTPLFVVYRENLKSALRTLLQATNAVVERVDLYLDGRYLKSVREL